MTKLLTVQQVADMLSMNTHTVRRRVADGQLKAIKISERGDLRFRQSDVEAYMAKRETLIEA